jgi:hypothetical protein
MITPAPTLRIDPKLARGILSAITDATATRPATITLTIPNTSYEVHLVPGGPIKASVGQRIIGVISAEAKRVDTVKTCGRFIEPVYGRPRRVQGSVVAVETGSNAIVIDATVPIHCRLTDSRQKAADFQSGQFVSCDIMDGARFEERA